MKQVVVGVVVAAMLSGCATIQHPSTPSVQYASVEQCQQLNPESPAACAKVMHRQATNEAVATGAVVAGTLAWLGYIAYLLSILK